MITVEQIRAARVMLNLKQKELAKLAGISVATLNNIERGAQTDPKISTMSYIREALEKRGIEFIFEPFGGVGVCYKPALANKKKAVILIVDDNKADRTLYRKWLSGENDKDYHIVEASCAASGLDLYHKIKPDCVILDFMMYGTDGFQLLTRLKKEQSRCPPIVFITGMHNAILEESAKAQGVYCYLNKQMMRPEALREAVEGALKG